jgi:hypothetical protein
MMPESATFIASVIINECQIEAGERLGRRT